LTAGNGVRGIPLTAANRAAPDSKVLIANPDARRINASAAIKPIRVDAKALTAAKGPRATTAAVSKRVHVPAAKPVRPKDYVSTAYYGVPGGYLGPRR
jgi:hypothetical protein